jgi:outer membrane protein
MLATVACGLSGAPLAVAAGESATAPLSLREAITRALARNFTLRIEQQSVTAAEGELDAARAAYVPNLTGSAEFSRADSPGSAGATDRADNVSTSIGVSGLLETGATYRATANLSRTWAESTTTAGAFSTSDTARGTLGIIEISQPLLRDRAIDSTRLGISQSTLSARDAQLGALASAQSIVASVERGYFDLVAARETVRVREAALALAQTTLEDTRRRIEIGSLPDLEEKDAQAQVAASEADLISARQNQREAENALLQLIADNFTEARVAGVVPGDRLGSTVVALDFAASAARALANRPELTSAELAVEQRELALRFQRNQRLPEVNLVGSVGLTGADDASAGVTSQWSSGDYPYYTAGVTVSLPWSDRRTRGKTKSAAAQLEQAKLAVEQLRESILVALDSAVESVRSSYERIKATTAAREFAEAALAAEERKFASGKSTSFTVLQKQRDVTSARADEIVALADYNKALATLRLREGTTLDAWQIQFRTPDAGTVRSATSQPAGSVSGVPTSP